MRWSQASLWLRLDKNTGASVTSPPHLTYAAARFHSASTPLMAQTQNTANPLGWRRFVWLRG